MNAPGEITTLLRAWSSGDQAAADVLLPLVYRELRAISSSELRRQSASVTLQATELVNEAFIRLSDQRVLDWADRGHFFAVASTVVRRVLLDAARRKLAARRDRRLEVPLHEANTPESDELSSERAVELLDLDNALTELGVRNERQARLVELRYFGGFSVSDAAAILLVSEATAERDWQFARAWLFRRLVGSQPE